MPNRNRFKIVLGNLVSKPSISVYPALSGTFVVGNTVSCSTGTWLNTPTSYSYQWYRGATLITGATSSSYTLVQADAGNTSNIYCLVTATNAAGSTNAESNAVAQVLTVRANSYISATSTTDNTLRGAINTFDIGLTSNSIDSRMRGVYFFNLGSAAKCKFNLMDSRDLDAAFRLQFVNTVAGDFTSNGWTPNFSNSYARTFFTPSVNASTSGIGHGIYSRTNSTTGTAIYGCVSTGTSIFLQNNLSAGNFVSGSISQIISYTASPTTRFLYNRRNSTTDMQAYRDGTSLGTNTTTCAAIPSAEFFFGARNSGTGSPDFYDNHQITVGVLDIGLTNTQALALRTLVDNFNATMGINV